MNTIEKHSDASSFLSLYRLLCFCPDFMVASIGMLVNSAMGLGSTLYAVNNVDPNTSILAFCKLRIYISQIGAMVYRWCLVAASVDRYALSSTNVRFRKYADLKTARRVVALIVAIWFVLPVHTLIFYNLNAGTCGIVFSPPMAFYHSIYTTVAGTALPITFMLTFAFLIHRNLVEKRLRRQVTVNQATTARSEAETFQRKRDQQVLTMLIVQIIVFAVLTLPLMVYNLYTAVSINVTGKSVDRVAIERFARFLADVIVYFFPVVSFCLYTMASRTFRDELIRVLRYATGHASFRNNNRIEPKRSHVTRAEANETAR